MDKYDKILEIHRKKRKKEREEEIERWNRNNPDKQISDDDIAPVNTERTWLNKDRLNGELGPLDYVKTILGTGRDIAEDAVKGVLNAGEGLLDAGTFVVGKTAELFGNDDFAEKAYGFQQRNLVEEVSAEEAVLDRILTGSPLSALNKVTKPINEERYSILGEKSDSLVQSAGQLGVTIGLQGVGVPWWATTGTTTFGQGATEAMQHGATSNEAAAYGAISAGSEVLFERLSGGIKFGGKALDDGLKKMVTNAISNKTWNTLARFGIDAVGEGTEEVLTEFASKIGEGLTFADDKTWGELLTSEEAMDNYLEAFIGGAVMGGGFNAGRVAKSVKTGRDYDTGFSDNEQTLINREVSRRVDVLRKDAAVKAETEKRIAEHPAQTSLNDVERNNIRKEVEEEFENGELDISSTQLSKKELAEIEEQVSEDLKKGYFDIDTIESTFAEGKTSRIRELKAEMRKPLSDEKKAEIQKEIDQLTLDKNKEMQKFVQKDYWLQESYRQELLKGEAFERESQDTDSEITKELVESAKAAGMNNTRKMHELFEYTNKIANDTDTKYGFINSKQLKSMGYSMEDATINGMVRVQEDGSMKVLINVDSGKALNTIIGHETTHLLEGTQEHKDLVEVVKEYALMKGDYDGRIKAVTELYRNVDANIENEVTADLVGDYIFTDEQFVMNLTKKPNVFQKVYDYIKHAYKMATAGSAEARQLLKAKRAFERAYKSMPAPVENSSTRYALENYTDHQLKNWENSKKIVVCKDKQHLVDFVSESKQNNTFRKMYFGIVPESLAERVLNDTGVDIKGRNVALASNEVRKIFKSHGKEKKEQDRGQRAVETEDFVYIKEVIESPDDIKLSDETYEGHPVIIFTKKIGGDVAVVTYDVNPQNDLRVQTMYLNKNVTKKRSLATVIDGGPPNITSETASGTASSNIISQNKPKNNDKFSISDNQGRALSKEQQEYFKDSKVVDESGRLKLMYHGTADDFTVFNPMLQGGKNGTAEGYGIYFADTSEVSDAYGGKLMSGYLNVTHPATSFEKTIKKAELVELIKTTAEAEARKLVDDGEYDSVKEAIRDTWVSNYVYTYDMPMSEAYKEVASSILDMSDSDMSVVQEVMSGLAIRDYEEAYDFYDTLKRTLGVDGFITEWENENISTGKALIVVAFDSNQFKNADNINPTDNPDVRYSLSDSVGRELTEKQREYFKDSKMRDENGSLKVMYHGTENTGFHKFNSNFSDDRLSFFFTDNNTVAKGYSGTHENYVARTFRTADDVNKFIAESGEDGYVVKEEDGEFVLYDNTYGFKEGTSNTAGGIYEEFAKAAGLDGSANYEVYLDIKNPLMVDADGRNWDELADENQAEHKYDYVIPHKELGNDSYEIKYYDWGKQKIEVLSYEQLIEKFGKDNADILTNGYVLDETLYFGKDGKPLPNTTRQFSEYAEKNGYDGVIFKNIKDNALYASGMERFLDSTVAVVFDSNQIKSVANENPTEDADIRYSLSESDDIAPVGGYAVYGKDVKLTDEDILPIRDDIAPARTIDNDVEEADPSMFEDGEPIADYDDRTVPMDKESMRLLTKNMKEVLGLNRTQRGILKGIIQDYSTGKIATPDDLYAAISEQFGVQTFETKSEELQAAKKALRETRMKVSDEIKDSITDYFRFRQSNFGKLRIANEGMAVDDLYGALNEVFPGYFPDSIDNQEDQLYRMAEVAGMDGTIKEEYVLPEEKIAEATDFIRESVSDYKRGKKLKASLDQKYRDATPTRKEIHAAYVKKIKDTFAEKGMDFDSVLENGKNLSTFASVDNTPQRFMEKTFGYKEGQLLSDLTVNQAAENETEAIRWLNSFTNKKNGTLAKLSKKYNIKPFSKEDAAAQKYAEGMYVNQYGDYVEYGDRQLEYEIKDPQMRANIKAFVTDPTLRKIYDETLDAINASRTRNGYPSIPRRKDYFLHFREMDDTFSKIGIPFNPNDIKAKDLPTDINGMTADNKPGQPWFGSQMQRKGVGTTYSLLGGMERYLTAAKPQIYHIDDIQILRALRNFVADTYGQAKGLESLDEMTDEEAEARIEQVYGAHLSTFAKFLNEEANIMAGKTALIDRGMEGVLGRRAISFMNTLNSQVAKNMIGFNLSSSLTNFVSVTQAAAKASKYDVIKAFAQTSSNKVKSIFGKGDGFAEQNSAIVRRKGQDKFYKKPWEKASDMGFIFMSAIDDVSTEFIVRTKYNELTRKGMDEIQAHDEAGKWAMRILGDRSFGQMPQIFNSKTLGLVTKFQLEVRNQLDSMFYDTIQEANVSTEEIQNETKKNAVKAAKITSTMVQLAVFQHLFGKAFESVAGYNPTFDIIENLMILFGFDDEEDSEDTFTDNLEEALLGLGEDLPYFSALTGGRIPIESALPIEQFVQGTDDYGNEKPRVETLKEAAPYYFWPTGYGQYKKSKAGLKMFDEDLPLPGSYTDKGALRFPVEPTPQNMIQAFLFGQWANENAREYFDGEHKPLEEKQIQEFKDLDLPIADYWKIREGMTGLETHQQKVDYINDLDLPISKKNILANNALNRDEEVDLTNYDDYGSLEEMDFAVKNPDTYAFAKSVGGYQSHQVYSKALSDIHADKDEDGKSISGSRKEKVIDYINNLDADYYTKIILYKSEYKSDDSYNNEIIEYLRNRDDINDEEMKLILLRLGFTVDDYGNVGW